MKALDTSVLVALLEGDRAARDLVRKLRGVEVATTEANLLELSYLAAQGSSHARSHRQESLERLRRRLTVLPIDARAVGNAGHLLRRGADRYPPTLLAMMGALEAGSCDELFTFDRGLARGRWKVRISLLSEKNPKERK